MNMKGSRLNGYQGNGSLLGPFTQEADAYFRTMVDANTYQRIMGYENGRAHPYVAARILMDNAQWEKYVWISHHGSLAGFLR